VIRCFKYSQNTIKDPKTTIVKLSSKSHDRIIDVCWNEYSESGCDIKMPFSFPQMLCALHTCQVKISKLHDAYPETAKVLNTIFSNPSAIVKFLRDEACYYFTPKLTILARVKTLSNIHHFVSLLKRKTLSKQKKNPKHLYLKSSILVNPAFSRNILSNL